MPVEPPQSTLTSSTPIPAERLLDVKKLKKYFPIRKGFFKSNFEVISRKFRVYIQRYLLAEQTIPDSYRHREGRMKS